MSDRSKIAARVRALLAKTAGNGCTEDEAMAAVAKAAELMAKHQIDMTETELLSEGFGEEELPWESRKGLFARVRLADAIANYTDTQAYSSALRGSCKKSVKFFGLASDALFACWLCESLTSFVTRTANEYTTEHCAVCGGRRNEIWNGFALGACVRISERLGESKAQSVVRPNSGHWLVPIDKSRIVADELARRVPNMGKASRRPEPKIAAQAYYRGREAGNDASFAKPIGETTILQIESGVAA